MALDYKSSLDRYRRYLQVTGSKPMWQASAFVIFSLILIIVMVLLALRPTLVTISGLLGEIKQEREVSQLLARKIADLGTASEKLENNRGRLPRLDEALPTLPTWEEWAEEVLRVATESGVAIDNFAVGEVQIKGKIIGTTTKKSLSTLPDGVSSISFNLSGEGSYATIVDFLGKIENLPRLAVLNNVSITKNNDGGVSVVLSGVIGYEEVKN